MRLQGREQPRDYIVFGAQFDLHFQRSHSFSCPLLLMATKGTAKLAQQLSSIAVQWPRDPFRPHLLLPTFLQSLSKHPKLTPEAVQAAHALKSNRAQKQVYFSREARLSVNLGLFPLC